MNKSDIIDLLKVTADGLQRSHGEGCEVSVHDLTDLRHSLVYIVGNVSGRELGAPITDLIYKRLLHIENITSDSSENLYNYRSTTKDGRVTRNTTLFYRDSFGKIVACMSFTFDLTDLIVAKETLEGFVGLGMSYAAPSEENLADNFNETMDSVILEIIATVGKGKDASQLNKKEKVKVVEMLERRKVFEFRGVVLQVARILDMSRHTVYNYLKEIRLNK
jgi:predicted transcriptional regulator YheO